MTAPGPDSAKRQSTIGDRQSSLAARNLTTRDLAVLWHPCSQMRDYEQFAPLPVVAAKNCRIRLADGRELLDCISSWWCKSLGHGHPRLLAALRDQAEAFEHVILANTTNEPVVRLCERLLAAANGLDVEHWGPDAPPGKNPGMQPGHFGRVFLADNGSTAVEIALKMALQAQTQRGQANRTKFAALRNGYHGETLGALSVGDLGLYSAPYKSIMFPVTMLEPLPYRSGPDDPDWMNADAQWAAIRTQLEPVAHTLAAIIYEPVLQGAGGMHVYSPRLLEHFRGWADDHDVYLIADEIAAGMGRCGAMLASHLTKFPASPAIGHRPSATSALPDFAVVSKGLTGGVIPLSACLTTDAIYQLFYGDYFSGRAFMHSNTWTGHALAVAVANAALDVMADEHILQQVADHGPIIRDGLRQLADERPYFTHYRGLGMVAALDLQAPDGSPLDPRRRTGFRIYQEAVRRGALLRNLGDTLYLFPPLNTAPADLHAMVNLLADSAAAVMA